QVTFKDDGPSIQVAEGEGDEGPSIPSLAVDESFLTAATNGVDGTTPDVTQTHVTENFSGVFSHVDGADGAKITYALNIATPVEGEGPVDSGLIDSATGGDVCLVLNGATGEGHAGSACDALVFSRESDTN